MLLNEIGIKSSKIKIRKDNTYDLRISGRENILKFKDKVNFGHHTTKNKKITEFINSYTELQLPKSKRYEQILAFLNKKNYATISEISRNLDVTYSLVWLRVMELQKQNIVTEKKNLSINFLN